MIHLIAKDGHMVIRQPRITARAPRLNIAAIKADWERWAASHRSKIKADLIDALLRDDLPSIHENWDLYATAADLERRS